MSAPPLHLCNRTHGFFPTQECRSRNLCASLTTSIFPSLLHQSTVHTCAGHSPVLKITLSGPPLSSLALSAANLPPLHLFPNVSPLICVEPLQRCFLPSPGYKKTLLIRTLIASIPPETLYFVSFLSTTLLQQESSLLSAFGWHLFCPGHFLNVGVPWWLCPIPEP